MKPGVYSDVSFDAYLAIPAITVGVVETIASKCAKAAWFESYLNPNPVCEESVEMDVGTIAHAMVLEGRDDGVVVIDPNDHPAAVTGNIPDGWTNKSIRAARDAARADGKIPIFKPRWTEIEACVASVRGYIHSLAFDDQSRHIWRAFQPGEGDSEMTVLWNEGGVGLCKIRPDRFSRERDLIVDLKFTSASAEPDAWGRAQLVREGQYVRAAFYKRGCARAIPRPEPEYVFLVCETTAPYLCSLVGVDPHATELGRMRVDSGLNLLSQHMRVDRWPGYPTRICYPEIPAYEDAKWAERLGVDRDGIPYDITKLFVRTDQ